MSASPDIWPFLKTRCRAACRQEKKVRELRHPCIESETDRRKRHKSTLAEESAEARKHGMTYGQWKAKKYMEKMHDEKNIE